MHDSHPRHDMKLKTTVFAILWAGALVATWRSTQWTEQLREDRSIRLGHDADFHMHAALHPGGKVRMVGQLHLELESRADGTHSLWISNAFRQEIDPAGFVGSLAIELADGSLIEAPLEREDRTKRLVARTIALPEQAWVRVNAVMGRGVLFENIEWYWDFKPTPIAIEVPLGLDPMLPVPADNRPSRLRMELGRELFFDPLLSSDASVSCATCHRPEHGFADSNAIAVGVAGRTGRRNTQSILNSAYQRLLYFDGRARSLEKQAIEPLLEHSEMGFSNPDELVARLLPVYGTRIRAAFDSDLSLETIGMALACYERSLLSGDSDFDRHENGDIEAIGPEALLGRALFFGKAACGNCHTPSLFTDSNYHNLGVGWIDAASGDRGRFEITADTSDLGAFRTPSLRDVNRTAPYMHDGSFATLREVLEFYNRGGIPNENLDPMIEPLALSENELKAILAFLKTLDGRSYPTATPADSAASESTSR